jgi:hypothetical protein
MHDCGEWSSGGGVEVAAAPHDQFWEGRSMLMAQIQRVLQYCEFDIVICYSAVDNIFQKVLQCAAFG